MSFVSFLKNAGKILANIAAVEGGLEPIFKAALPASASPAVDKLDLIFKSVVAIEGEFEAAFPGQQTGPQKLLAAASLVGPVLGTVDTITGKPIADEAALLTAIQQITAGVANYMNALQAKANTATAASAIMAPAVAISTK